VTGIPGAENVHLIGKGYQGDDHYGLKNLTLHYAFNNKLHAKELLEEDFENGYTRFQAWHFDAPLYKRDTAWFVSFRTIKLPVGPDMQVNWDDGSGLSMKCKPGRTAFFSSSQLYDLLTEKEKHMADHSFVEYMYYPYEWIRQCRGRPHGMGLVSEGLETSMEEMEKLKGRDPAWTKRVKTKSF
jgi:hypothetical protein